MHEGQEAIITLTRHKNETEQKLEKLLKGVRKEQKEMTFSPNHTVYTQRKLDKPWTIQKLRNFLSDLVEVNQQVNLGRRSVSQVDNKPTSIKGGQKQNYKPDKTSALSTLQTNQKDRAYFALEITGIASVMSILRLRAE
uniref:Uncharacterized protein n=1 Tax=Onchocerca volvulus TaxID=6282 RepID=A0A8R1TWS6_ONCVO